MHKRFSVHLSLVFIFLFVSQFSFAAAKKISNYSLELGGQFAGYITQVETNDGNDNRPIHFKLEFSQTSSVVLNDWIKGSFERNHRRSDGAIHASDGDGTIVSSIDFFNGLITELGFPSDDPNGKDPHKLSIGFVVDTFRHKPGSGKIEDLPQSPPQKIYIPSAFRLSVDGVDQTVMGGFSEINIRQNETSSRIRMIFVPSNDFLRWYSEFFTKEQNGRHRTGSIQYISRDKNDALFNLQFYTMGIFKHSLEKADANFQQKFELIATTDSVEFAQIFSCVKCQR